MLFTYYQGFSLFFGSNRLSRSGLELRKRMRKVCEKIAKHMWREKVQENCGNLNTEGFFYHAETFFISCYLEVWCRPEKLGIVNTFVSVNNSLKIATIMQSNLRSYI